MKSTLLAFVFVLFAGTAHAGLMLEPYIGFESGQVVAVNHLAGDLSAKTSGLMGGIRVAYSLPILFWAGLDYSMLPTGSARPDIVGENYNYSRSDLYLVAGVDLPILFRVWAGYGLMNSLVLKKSTGDETYTGGTSLKLGVGFKMIPFVTVFLEGYNHKAKDVSANGIDGAISDFFGAYEDGGFTIGASFPLDI